MTSRNLAPLFIALLLNACVDDTAPQPPALTSGGDSVSIASTSAASDGDPRAFTIVSIEDQKKGGSTNPVRPPRYILRVVRAGLTTEPELIDSATVLATLRALLEKVKIDGTDEVDGITAFLYPSTAHANGSSLALGRAEWWPRGHSFAAENDPNILNKATYETSLVVIAIPTKADSVVSRFTEAERRAIFADLVRAQDRATKESEASSALDSEKHDRLRELYEGRVRAKYGLTKKELDSIALEGGMENWPLPTF